jgi:hypothetical protein
LASTDARNSCAKQQEIKHMLGKMLQASTEINSDGAGAVPTHRQMPKYRLTREIKLRTY